MLCNHRKFLNENTIFIFTVSKKTDFYELSAKVVHLSEMKTLFSEENYVPQPTNWFKR